VLNKKMLIISSPTNQKGIIKESLLWKRVKDDSAWSQLWCICKPVVLYFFCPKQVLICASPRGPLCVHVSQEWLAQVKES